MCLSGSPAASNVSRLTMPAATAMSSLRAYPSSCVCWARASTSCELADLSAGYVFDGEIVAFKDGRPYFPLVCERLLHGSTRVPLTYVIFDVLAADGEPTMGQPYRERRALLDCLGLGRGPWFISEPFDDGKALFGAVCEHGLEGVVAKRRGQRYRPGERGWIKTKNKDYWALWRGAGVAAPVDREHVRP
jgi:ATP-dependent DNA ligase